MTYSGEGLNRRTQILAGGPNSPTHRWWDAFAKKWGGCKLCPLHQHRNKVVQFRGIIPADILFIGEAPWISEDELGRPFVGPAGRELDKLLEAAGIEDGEFCLVNIVACIPRQLDQDGKPCGGPRPPENTEARTCAPRLKELIEHIKPKLVVRLGNVAGKYIDPFLNGQPVIDLVHPSFIIQKEQKSPNITALLRKRFTLELRQAASKMRERIGSV